MNKTKGKDKVDRYLKDALKRREQSGSRDFTLRPDIIQDPTNPAQAIPEASTLYPSEVGGKPTGVGSDGVTPYSPAYYNKKDTLSPGDEQRDRMLNQGLEEKDIPIGKDGQVKRLLRHLRKPPPVVS